ncbi:MAG: hypothetical protein ACSHX2_15265 [Rubritalea sp.]
MTDSTYKGLAIGLSQRDPDQDAIQLLQSEHKYLVYGHGGLLLPIGLEDKQPMSESYAALRRAKFTDDHFSELPQLLRDPNPPMIYSDAITPDHSLYLQMRNWYGTRFNNRTLKLQN